MKGKGLVITIAVAIGAYLCYELWIASGRRTEVIHVETGALRGSVAFSRDGREYFEWLGIPFAKPPVGELRYELPEPADDWDGVREATKYGNKCPQLDLLFTAPTGDEDCLFLNVFSPKLATEKSPNLLPVMVFFHGGIYFFGSGNGYRADFLMDEDVVLVTVNYRLSSFGFLNTGDGRVPGNMGLKDQSMALKWIKRNIRSFGGDPNLVTLVGESAGAASSHLHMVSPLSKGLFHRVISQSGASLNPWTIWTDPGTQAKRFGAKLGCPTDRSEEMIACLKNQTMYDIMIIHQEVLLPFRDMVSLFVPTVESGKVNDQTFLSAHPRELLTSGQYHKVPWLAGANSQDGLIFSSAIIKNDTVRDLVYQDFATAMPRLVLAQPNPEAAEKLKKYFMPTLPTLSDRESFLRLTDMFTDRSFFNGIHEAAVLQSSKSPVFLYHYSYKGEFRACNLLIAIKRKYPIVLEFSVYALRNLFEKYILRRDLPFYGVSHMDELAMLFNMPWITNVKRGHVDYDMSKAFVKLWTSFAQKKDMQLLGVPWKPIDGKDPVLKYLNISETPAIIDDPFAERYAFWQSLNLTGNC